MAELLRHRQTKGAATDMFYLTPPRHISTLPKAALTGLDCDFRYSPGSGHNSDIAGGPFRAMCGRLRVGKDFLRVLQDWSVQPCVRPFNAVHMTAGHNALRGSGPALSEAALKALHDGKERDVMA